jgi:hypothetical protein
LDPNVPYQLGGKLKRARGSRFRHTPRETNFGSSSSVPKMDLSRSTLRAMAGGIYRMLFSSGFRPSLPSRPPSLSLGVYSLFSRIHVSSHGRTIIAIPACLKLRDSLFTSFSPLASHSKALRISRCFSLLCLFFGSHQSFVRSPGSVATRQSWEAAGSRGRQRVVVGGSG